MELQVTSGIIEDLTTHREKVSIIFGSSIQNVNSATAISLAVAGLSAAAAQTTMNSDAAFDDVEIYEFRIRDKQYTGMCRNFSAKMGDRVDVVTTLDNPSNALAVRRPSTRSIWVLPYMSKGYKAGILHGFQTHLVACLCMIPLAFLATILMVLVDNSASEFAWKIMLPILSLGSFILLPPMAIWIAPKYYRRSVVATKIFRVIGFDRPEWVNLAKSTRLHLRTCTVPLPDFRRDELRY